MLALRGNLHIIIHGESGTGKSWLYKKTFRDAGVQFLVANLANASRLGSIAAEL
jgi:DNA replicative helicase MCM subunit Mcm2 (Cdc46/Mcm family)